MNKKVLLISILVGILIFTTFGVKASNQAINTIDRIGIRSTNNSRLSISGDVVVQINHTQQFRNFTMFYISTAGVWTKATLAGVSGNTTCVANNCNLSKGIGTRGNVTWTVPGEINNTAIKIQINRSLGTIANLTPLKISIDTTAPRVSLALANNHAFKSRGALAYWPLLARVSDPSLKNCTLWTNANDGTTFKPNRTTTNQGFINQTSSAWFVNITLSGNRSSVTPPRNGEGKYTWGVSCFDNATSKAISGGGANGQGEASSNLTFYYDTVISGYDSTYPIWFDDSDANDNSKLSTKLRNGVYVTELLETITINCDTTEPSVQSIDFLVKQPGQSDFHSVKTQTAEAYAYTDTKSSGTFEAKCTTTNYAGNTSTSSTKKFLLEQEEEAVTPSTGGVGGAGGVPAITFNIDLSKAAQASANYKQGRIATFTLDGTVKHTVTFNEVTSTSATLIIASTPKTIILNIGDTKNVDINDDGIDDVSATLQGITSGTANVIFKKLEGAQKVIQEEAPTTTLAKVTPTTQPAIAPTKTTSKAWIWWVIIIIIIIVIVYFVIAKRKKKQ